jgi:hypothetical protein
MNTPSLFSRFIVASAKCGMLLVACIAVNSVVFAVRDERISLPLLGTFREASSPTFYYSSIAGCIALAVALFTIAAIGLQNKA